MKKKWPNAAARGAWIFYQLRLRGITGAQIARELSPPVSTKMVCGVINGESNYVSRRVRAAVAAAIGLKEEQLWPEAGRDARPTEKAEAA